MQQTDTVITMNTRGAVLPALNNSEWIGRHAVWHQKLRRQDVTVLVKIVDVVERFDRRDCLIETNTGAQAWVSDKTLKLVPEKEVGGNWQVFRGKK